MKTQSFEELQNALKKFPTVSARQLAKTLKCSLPTVYRRIEALKEAGAVVAEVKERRKKTGPTPRKFVLVREAP